MNIGALRQVATIQENSPTTVNAANERVDSWATFEAGVRCSIKELSGRELEFAARKVANVTHEVSMRYRAGVTPRMRIYWGTRTLNIEAVIDPEGLQRELKLLCVEDK